MDNTSENSIFNPGGRGGRARRIRISSQNLWDTLKGAEWLDFLPNQPYWARMKPSRGAPRPDRNKVLKFRVNGKWNIKLMNKYKDGDGWRPKLVNSNLVDDQKQDMDD